MVVRDFVLKESIPHPTIKLGTALRFGKNTTLHQMNNC